MKDGKSDNKKNGKKDDKRISIWSVLVKYWSLFVWTLVVFLAIWTALFVAAYDFARYTNGASLASGTPFAEGARFGAALVFLKDYGIFTIPIMTLATITLALILDAQENARMTISRWLRMKADEEIRAEGREEGRTEGRTQGIAEGIAVGETRGIAEGIAVGESRGRAEGMAEGIAATNDAWDSWLRRMREAERDGKPFNEPPPSSR